MKITRLEKILLALMLAGSLAQSAAAATKTIYQSDDKTITVTADVTEKSVTYTDANGKEQTYTYSTIDNSSIQITITGLEYDSPNATTGTGTTSQKYYAWVEEIDETTEEPTGKYVFTDVTDEYLADSQSTKVNVTVSYVENTGDYKDGVYNTADTKQNITADFVGDDHEYTGGSTNYGGAIDNYANSGNASLGTITGNFIGNYEVPSQTGAEYGGAIANYGSGGTASITAINGNFIGNYVHATGTYTTTDADTGVETTRGYAAYGGAIYNAGTIGTFDEKGNSVDEKGDPAFAINADFVGNYAESELNAYGGAIYNSGTIGNVKGNFIGNYATTGSGEYAYYAQGGAIYTNGTIGDITANFIGNFVNSSSTYSYGGAIHNGGTIASLNGNFIGNYVKLESESITHGNGGAIENTGAGEIKNITGNFICNYVEASGLSSASGGAINNEGTIGDIEGDFIGNYAKMIYEGSSDNRTNRNAHGGAISNDTSSVINSVTGNFISNSATSTGDNAFGGAIYNSGKIGTENSDVGITGDFIDNHTYGDSEDSSNHAYAWGGAIYNGGTIYGIKGDFIGNSAESATRQAYGGAIYNTNKITLIDGDFIGNYAKTTNSRAYGGAIYNTGTITLIKGDFIGNYAETSANTTGTTASNYAAYGGAIDNTGGTIGSIEGDFISNHANSNASYAYGGAIYNAASSSNTGGTIESIAGNFIGNYATSSSETSAGAVAWGGAIYNTGTISGSTSSDGSGTTTAAISANFIENYATSSANDSYGGAIYNNGTIGTITSTTGTDGTTSVSVSVDGISGSTFQGNTANRGGAIYNGTDKSTAESGDGIQDGVYTGIIASITDSSFVKNSATAFGGAIYNYADGAIYSIAKNYFGENEAEDGNGGAIENAEANSYIGTITGNTFYKNQVTKSDHGGGAIYSEGIIGSLSKNNFIENKSGNFGGAIYNNGGSIAGGGGTIAENYFYKNESNRGGAIYNTVTRSVVSDETLNELGVTETFDLAGLTSAEGSGSIFSITGNTFMYNKANNFGGAIYNYHGGDIGAISDNLFYGNEADGGNGGAVENAEFDTSIGTMDNNVFAYNTSANFGGAIYNQGTIGIDKETGEAGNAITNSTFVGNEAKSGGAIYNNYGTSTVYFYDEENSTYDENAKAVDGAEKNADGNTLYSVEEAGAGAIGNISNCYFEGNKATSGSGGAIYNASGTADNEKKYTTTMGTITNTSFVNNSATENGGAIYSATDLTIAADGSQDVDGDSTVIFKGNTAGSDDNAIYMATHYDENGTSVASNLSFSLTNGGKIYLYDNIQGDSGYSVDISGDGLNNIFYLLNDVKDANLSVGGALISPDSIKPFEAEPTDPAGDEDDSSPVTGNLTLSTLNGDAHVYSVSSFTVAGDFNMEADVDLKNEKMDHFETTDGTGTGLLTEEGSDDLLNENGHSGTLNVSALNIYSDTTKNSVAVYFAEEGLMGNVTSSVSSALGPIYEYDLTYLYKDSSGNVYDQSGTIYEGDDFDTSLLESKDSGGYFVFGNTGRNNPAVVAPAVAQMGTLGAFNMMLDYNFEHSDYYMKLPEDLRLAKIEEAKTKKARRRIAESDPTRPAYYNRNELTYRGAWFRSFAANESVSYRGRYTSRDKYWGGLVGFDTDMREHENGWATVFTGFAGTTGIRQEYSGGHIKQHGGMIGATANFYKKNFYTAWTVAAGTSKAHEHTMYGKDKERIDEYGIAARFGWNIDMDYNGKFAILPTFTASYSYIHPEDFTNSADVKITGSGMRAVQLNPNVKLIWKMNDGWQPYLTIGEVWTVGQSLHMRTNGQKLLDELELRAYAEYGIGLQKRWADEKDAYIQLLGHSDGRDGILVNAGFRWNF